MSETTILLTIRDSLVAEPGVLLWRNNTGKLQDARGRWITYGLGVGGADLIGLVRDEDNVCRNCGSHLLDVGRFFALEVKDLEAKGAKARPTPEQEAWAGAVRAHGGFCATVRSVDEARAALERCRRGESG